MKQLRKFRSNYFFTAILIAVMLCTITWKTAANRIPVVEFRRPLTIAGDTIIPHIQTDSLKRLSALADTPKLRNNDSSLTTQKTDTFFLKISKDSLEAPLKYEAEDSVVVMVQDKKIILYGKTKTDYKDITLIAPKVELDQQTQVVTAFNKKDSTGDIVENATFKSADNQFTSDTIRYNFKTQVGLTRNTFTEDGGMFVQGAVAKKINENTTFIKKARFTTCDLDDPHFAFISDKMKVINKKLAVSGPVHPEFEGVAIPIYLPFGFFPLSQGRHSGLLPPQFTTNEQYGLGLEGLGYYKVLNNYWDVKVYGNVYSYGGWSANINPTYRKRYRYNGTFNFSMQNTKQNFKGDPDFLNNKSYFITWSHSVDSRARPGTTFSANVNAGSTKFNRLIPNNTQANFNNQLGSSISYSKTWAGKPYNLTLSANHSQNNLSHLINISLPDAGFSVSTLYPFQKKDFVGTAKWYEKLGIGYSGSFSNTISFYDTLGYGKNGVKPFFKYLLDTAQWDAHHNIPITLSLPPILGGSVVVSPGISYSQDWLQRITKYEWDTAAKKVDTTTSKGLFIDQRASFSLNFNTALFGTLNFKHSSIKAIRHVIRPTVGFSYTPDLNKGHIHEVQVDTTYRKLFYNEIGGSILYYANSRKSAALNFGIENNLEMKVRSKTDTSGGGDKKIRLIDGFGFSGSYDLIRDSLKLSPFQFHFNTNLFDKINISASTTLDPYKTDKNGNDIDEYAWQGGKFKPGRLTTGSISLSTSFKSKPKDPKKEEERKKQVEQRLSDPSLIADQQRLLDYMQQNPSEFVDFNIPWQVSFGYSLFFSNQLKPDFSGFKKEFNSNVNFNGSFSLTPKWNFSVNGYYDFTSHKLQTFQMSINREMHCWQMSINIVPVGLYRSFNFSISPKSSVLQDLKINRSRSFPNY
jgi:LptD protein